MADLENKLAELKRQSTRWIDLSTIEYDPAKFWANVEKTDTCWLWTASTRKGYGKFHPRRGVTITAHRYAYYLEYGIDLGADLGCHSCDEPRCCFPAHIFPGSHKANSDDKIAKGRNRSPNMQGEKNARAKLTERDVNQIRTLITHGYFNTEIAEIYGVSHDLISRIRLGKAWAGPRRKGQENMIYEHAMTGKLYGSLTGQTTNAIPEPAEAFVPDL